MICIGILAAIAIPALLNQRFKAGDAVAKSLMSNARVTVTNYGLKGNYTGLTPAALKAIEPSINTTANGQAVLASATPTANGFILSVVSSNADTFNVTDAGGVVTRACIVAAGNGNTTTNTGGGCTNGTW